MVHLAASCGGATSSRSGTADVRDLRRRPTPPEGEGWTRDPDVLDTWFSSALWPFATLGWPEQTRRAAGLLPDRRARHRPRHHLPLGRADDHDGHRVHRRDPVLRRLHPLDHPGARRPADVEVAGHRHRPARPDRRRPAPTRVRQGTEAPASSRPTAPTRCAGACWRCPRARTCASPRSKIAQGQQLTNKLWNAARLVLLGVDERRARGGSTPSAVEDRWILSRLAARPGRGRRGGSTRFDFSPRRARAVRLRLRRAVRLVPGAGQAAAAGRRARAARDAAVRADRDARARAPADPVRDRGDLGRYIPGPRGCSPRGSPAASRVPARGATSSRGRGAARRSTAIQALRAGATRAEVKAGAALPGAARGARLRRRPPSTSPGWRGSTLRRRRRPTRRRRAVAAARDSRAASIEILAGGGCSTSSAAERQARAPSAELDAEIERAERKLANERLRRQGARRTSSRPSATSSSALRAELEAL